MDIIGGRCVRLNQGNYSTSKIYSDDPVSMARRFEDAGLRRLHLVDLDGAKAASVVNIAVLEKIASSTSLVIDFGGGVKSETDIRRVFDAGAAMVCLGSMAQTDPATTTDWLAAYGPDRIILGMDVWNGRLCINGWKTVTTTTVSEFLGRYAACARHIICTDITRDGMLQGPAVGLYSGIMAEYPSVNLTASGGVSSASDLEALRRAGVPAVIVGKAIYENLITPEQVAAMNGGTAFKNGRS